MTAIKTTYYVRDAQSNIMASPEAYFKTQNLSVCVAPDSVYLSKFHCYVIYKKWMLRLYSHPMNFLQNTSVFGNISFFGTYSSDDLGVTCMLHTNKIRLSEYSED